MGVHGLWKLLEASGKAVPLETLDNKVLAVDVSIWLHQLVKGFQDSKGSSIPNAHLLGLFHRVCKLLYYRIKPVFVFDGGVPLLKRQTIAARKKLKTQATQDAARIREQLLKNLIKRKAVRRVLQGKESSDGLENEGRQGVTDMFYLPPQKFEESEDSESELRDTSDLKHQLVVHSGDSDSDLESEQEFKISPLKNYGLNLDLHSLDVTSEQFLSLPPDVRHDILSELQETRKQNSWGRLHEMPEESCDFSSFQLGRLIKRRNVQVSLEKAEKEMGGKVLSLNELQDLMCAQGVNFVNDETTKLMDSASRKLASDAGTRYLLLKEPFNKESCSIRQESEVTDNDETCNSNEVQNTQSLFKDSWSSDEELEQDRINDMLAKALDSANDDLSQEQILALIQSSKGSKTVESDNGTISVPSTSTSNGFRAFAENQHVSVQKDVEKPFEVNKDYKSPNDENALDVEEIFEEGEPRSSKESEVKCKKPHAVLKHKMDCLKDKEREDQTKVLPADSDSDDFQDVEESSLDVVPVEGSSVPEDSSTIVSHTQDFNGETSEKKDHKTIEIVINPRDDPGDDIFADIFSNSNVHCDSKEPISDTLTFLKSKEGKDDVFALSAQSPSVQDVKSLKLGEQNLSNLTEERDTNNATVPKSSNENISSPETGESSEVEERTRPFFAETFSTSDLEKLESSLQEEEHDLSAEKGRQERLAASITEQMCVEAQELLQLFGLPYIIAPMEAEAQCAFLDAISLTEGTITDDSDIWLFGGRKVYKNFFNQKKHVLQYTSTNIHHYFKLTREQLVQLALLVGSDYTVGLQGIGPVTAIEILAAFSTSHEGSPIENSLLSMKQFKIWCLAGCPHQSPQKQRLGKKLQNMKISDGFPNQAVIEAYLRPAVDDSRETFSWGALDLPALRDYARTKFGWSHSKTDEILLPVSKRWSDRTSQKSIDSYFNIQPKLIQGLTKMSKRVQRAVHSMSGQDNLENSEDIDDPEPLLSSDQSSKKRSSNNSDTVGKKRAKRTKINDSGAVAVKKKCEGNTEESLKELPVRAPTVPRNRTRQGIKRVGAKTEMIRKATKTLSNEQKESEMEQSLDIDVIPTAPKRVKSSRGLSDVQEKSNTRKNSVKAKAKTNARSLQKCTSNRSPSRACDDDDDPIDDLHSVPSTSSRKSCAKLKGDSPPKKTQSSMVENFPSHSRAPQISDCSTDDEADPHLKSSIGSLDQDTHRCGGDEDFEKYAAEELAAAAILDWHEEPWDSGASKLPERKPRQKLYFGGIRPNKPSKRRQPQAQQQQQPQPQPPPSAAAGSDSRGMRPGWRTEQQIQSRDSVWLETTQAKGEHVIPQREQDRRAQEQAKMRAIHVMKTNDSLHASRILGGVSKGSRRGGRARGKARPIRKELPQHELSESSSDE